MDRTEKTGLGVAVVGHILLFGLLSASLLWRRAPSFSHPPMDVTLSTEAAMESQAPVITEHPAQSQAPEVGPPEEAAPSAPAPTRPSEPQPTAPKPEPAPAPKPAEVSKPQPPKKQPTAKPRPQPAPDKTKGQEKAAGKHERGSLLGPNFLKGITAEKSDSPTQAPRASKVGARDMANIEGLIQRQVLPCYDLGSLKGTSAMSIITILHLQFRRDGSVASATVDSQSGIDGENQRYAQQVGEASRRAVLRCSPLRGLPDDLYQNGWDDFLMRFTPSAFG